MGRWHPRVRARRVKTLGNASCSQRLIRTAAASGKRTMHEVCRCLDLLVNICRQLPGPDRIRAGCVCRTWHIASRLALRHHQERAAVIGVTRASLSRASAGIGSRRPRTRRLNLTERETWSFNRLLSDRVFVFVSSEGGRSVASRQVGYL